MVRLGMGLVATMTALLLGLVTAAAKGTFDSQDVAIRNSAVNIVTLDRDLARYGPETAPTRDLVRRAVAARIESMWPAKGAAPPPLQQERDRVAGRGRPESDPRAVSRKRHAAVASSPRP